MGHVDERLVLSLFLVRSKTHRWNCWMRSMAFLIMRCEPINLASLTYIFAMCSPDRGQSGHVIIYWKEQQYWMLACCFSPSVLHLSQPSISLGSTTGHPRGRGGEEDTYLRVPPPFGTHDMSCKVAHKAHSLSHSPSIHLLPSHLGSHPETGGTTRLFLFQPSLEGTISFLDPSEHSGDLSKVC